MKATYPLPTMSLAAFRLLNPQIEKYPNFVFPQVLGPRPRQLVEIQGLTPGKDGTCALVKFAESPQPELVPLKVMHQVYPYALLSFYEEHIVLAPVVDPRAEKEKPLPQQ